MTFLLAALSAYLCIRTIEVGVNLFTWVVNYKATKKLRAQQSDLIDASARTVEAMKTEWLGASAENRAKRKLKGDDAA